METVANLRQETFHMPEAVQQNKEAKVEAYFEDHILTRSDKRPRDSNQRKRHPPAPLG